MRTLEISARTLLVVVFAVAVYGKASNKRSYLAFEHSLRQMSLAPPVLVTTIAKATIAAEAVVVCLLLIPTRWCGVAGFMVATGLLAAMTGVIGMNIGKKNRAPCNCFGASDAELGVQHILRNLGLAATAVLGATATLMALGAADLASGMLAAATGLVIGSLIVFLEDLIALFARG
ncbi:MauE/DoxX family redox-associated membrane protein [Micromonospora zhanjiangensis]|uniref:MauE/DoxX family redox-associated membrane protein n=1 Tax=Micromonospora zhanjiangensis TaxID=1522057 RepID=A0ABV8KQT2_9ACTN